MLPRRPPVFRHDAAPLCRLDDGPLAGLRHRTVIDARGGATALALWQEEHAPGFRVPPHRHDCEEIITVLEGKIAVELGDTIHDVGAGESILIAAGADHGFAVTSASPVRLLAIFSSACPRIFRVDGRETMPPWEGGEPDHLVAGVRQPSPPTRRRQSPTPQAG